MKEEIEEEQKQVEEEFTAKLNAIQKPKMLHFKFTEKIVESDTESGHQSSPSPPPRSRFSYNNNSPNGSQSPARTKHTHETKWKAVKPMVNTGIRVTETISEENKEQISEAGGNKLEP